MEWFTLTIQVLAVCGAVLMLALMILTQMPLSPWRALLVEVFGWTVCLLCCAYLVWPFYLADEIFLNWLGPFGDLAILTFTINSALAASEAGRDRKWLKWQQERERAQATVAEAVDAPSREEVGTAMTDEVQQVRPENVVSVDQVRDNIHSAVI